MSRYAIQWIIFVVFCAVNIWLWFGDDLIPDPPALEALKQDPPTQTESDPQTGTEVAAVEPVLAAVREQEDQIQPEPTPQPATPESTVATNDLERLRELLRQGRYEDAVELYSDLYNRLSEAESAEYRESILFSAEKLGSEQKHEPALVLLQAYVDVFYKDLTALYMLAYNQGALQRFQDQIQTLFAAHDEAITQLDLDLIDDKLTKAIAARATALAKQGEPEVLVAFYQSLIARHPGYIPLQLSLASAFIKTGQTDQAAAVLRNLSGTTEYSDEVEYLFNSIALSRSATPATIPIQRVGGSFVVDAVVNGSSTVKLLIDTGASMTVIHPDVLTRAGINTARPSRITVFNTASGAVNASVHQLQSLAVGDQVVDGIEVGSIQSPRLGEVDGLLGMNFLSEFKFSINQENQVIVLSR